MAGRGSVRRNIRSGRRGVSSVIEVLRDSFRLRKARMKRGLRMPSLVWKASAPSESDRRLNCARGGTRDMGVIAHESEARTRSSIDWRSVVAVSGMSIEDGFAIGAEARRTRLGLGLRCGMSCCTAKVLGVGTAFGDSGCCDLRYRHASGDEAPELALLARGECRTDQSETLEALGPADVEPSTEGTPSAPDGESGESGGGEDGKDGGGGALSSWQCIRGCVAASESLASPPMKHESERKILSPIKAAQKLGSVATLKESEKDDLCLLGAEFSGALS